MTNVRLKNKDNVLCIRIKCLTSRCRRREPELAHTLQASPASDLGVRRIGKSEQKCPVKETASVGISRPYSQFRAKLANDGRNTIWQLVG